jgi:multiple sugar transport system ATP-binding protein
MAPVSFDNVGKVYPGGTRAVDALSLEIHDGEFVVLVGPSGCGKTTALRMIAGLEEITSGEIRIGERIVNDLQPRERDIAMVFQNYALYPHMNVADNIGFGLRMRKMSKEQRRQKIEQVARTLELSDLVARKPGQLSGGQRQRVAMGRAIVREPSVFLMDEPLSNLDAKLRVQMRAELARLQRELGVTTVYVTHDQVEAMTMGDRVAVMRKGRLQQVGAPQFLYDQPGNLFVASFIGSPPMNLVEAHVATNGDGVVLHVGDDSVTVPEAVLDQRRALRTYSGRSIALGIRPEHVHDATHYGSLRHEARLHGRTVLTEALGSELIVHAELGARPILTEDVIEGSVEEAQDALDLLKHDAGNGTGVTVLGRFDPGSTVPSGEPIEFVINTDKLHFFDLDTGTAIDGAAVPHAVA